MKIRRVQELDIPDLPERLLAARKASDMSLLEICRQLNVSATYWYKLERKETNTMSYELLEKIDSLLSLDLKLNFSLPAPINPSINSENGMNLSRLKWLKLVTPQNDETWAYSREHLKTLSHPVIDDHGVTIFALGFKREGSKILESGDLMLLTQRTKITHVVEILGDQFFEERGWHHRYVKVVWWEPEMNWSDFPHRDDVLDFRVNVQQGIPFEIATSFAAFHERWDERGGLEAFQHHLARQLVLTGELKDAYTVG